LAQSPIFTTCIVVESARIDSNCLQHFHLKAPFQWLGWVAVTGDMWS
jgi:hypothetical protein